jgi:ribosomal protein S12 methylthiotransferase accessory factor
MNYDNLLANLHSIGLSLPEEKIPEITDEPKINGFFCYANNNAIKKYNTQEVLGQGFDTNQKIARIKSVGEFLERLCLDNSLIKNVNQKNFFQPDKNFVDPASFFCYSQEQIPNKEQIIKEIRDENYSWYPVINLTTKKEMFIPAQMIFLSGEFDDEYPLRKEQTSSGAAFGYKNSNLAIKNGLLELIERDAFISSYLTKKRVPLINGFSGEIGNLLNYLYRYRLETYILDITNDLNIPSIMAITLDKTGIGDAVSVGSKSDFNYNSAIKGAILESIQCRNTSRINRRINGIKKVDEKNVHTLGDRFEYWSDINRLNDLDFWINSEESVDYKNLPKKEESIEKILNILKERNYDVFVADISLPEIKERNFECLKIIIPQLHPLYLDERAKSLYSVHAGTIKDNQELKPHPLT